MPGGTLLSAGAVRFAELLTEIELPSGEVTVRYFRGPLAEKLLYVTLPATSIVHPACFNTIWLKSPEPFPSASKLKVPLAVIFKPRKLTLSVEMEPESSSLLWSLVR